MADVANASLPPGTAPGVTEPPPAPGASDSRPGELRRGPPPAAAPPPPPDAKAQPSDEERFARLERQTKEAARLSRLASDKSRKVEAEKAQLEKERAELLQWRKEKEAEEADSNRNPGKYLERRYGKDWKDKLSQVALTEAPTTDMVLSEVDERTNALRKEFDEREKKIREDFDSRETQRTEEDNARVRRDYEAHALAHIEGNAEKYPLIHAAGLTQNVGAVIAAHFNSTLGQDAEGNPTPGELLTAEQAAVKMEEQLQKLVDAAKAAEAKKKTAATPTSAVPGDSKAPATQRRTLSTSLVSRAPANWVAPKDDRERMARATAAWDAATKAGQ